MYSDKYHHEVVYEVRVIHNLNPDFYPHLPDATPEILAQDGARSVIEGEATWDELFFSATGHEPIIKVISAKSVAT